MSNIEYGDGPPSPTIDTSKITYYVDVDTLNLYSHQYGYWSFVSNMVGPAGPTGATGMTGPMGPPGSCLCGPSGAIGPVGVSGHPGPRGVSKEMYYPCKVRQQDKKRFTITNITPEDRGPYVWLINTPHLYEVISSEYDEESYSKTIEIEFEDISGAVEFKLTWFNSNKD